MHNIEHKPAQEEPASTPEQKGAMKTERRKLSRAWRYIIIGGSVLLVFAVIIAGLLTFANRRRVHLLVSYQHLQAAHQPSLQL